MNAKLLMIDDDEELCQITKMGLETDGYEIELAHDGVSGLEKFSSNKFDLVILDVMMPHMNGFKTINYIREFSDIPVIMLTARGDEADEILGHNLGADDYLQKPCSLTLLKAKIKNVLKRSSNKILPNKIISVGNFEIHAQRKKVYKLGEEIQLTKSQLQVLIYLCENQNKVCTKEELVKNALSRPYLKEQRSIDTHINNLREKLFGDLEEQNCSIKNIYGIGYELICK